jgi:HEAT repeat protein
VVPSRPVEDISGHDAAGERFDPHTAPISSPSLEVQETGQGSTISWLETARISGDAGIRCQAAVVAGSVGEMPDIPTLWCLMQDEDREVRLVAKTVFAELREKSVIDLLLKTVKGEQGSDGVHEVLLPLLSDESEELQGWAIWALGVLGDESVVEEIGRHFATGSRPVQREAVRTLALLGESGERLLLDSLHHPDPVVRSDVLAAIYQRGSQIVPAIVRMLPGMTDGQWHLYASILTMLGKGTLPYLYRELEADDELTGFRIAELLAGMGYEALVPLLEQIDKASNNKKRGILRALGLCPDPRAKEPILQALSDTDTEIRLLALRYARNLQVALSPFLLSWLDQANKDIRLEAVRTLGIEADPRAILPLMKRLKDPSEAVRTAAIQALEEIGDQIPKTSEGWIPPQ